MELGQGIWRGGEGVPASGLKGLSLPRLQGLGNIARGLSLSALEIGISGLQLSHISQTTSKGSLSGGTQPSSQPLSCPDPGRHVGRNVVVSGAA